MKILGIGNAIVDVLCKVNDEFLQKNSLTKSTMKLVNEIEFKNLLSSVEIKETISGGSVANSIVGLSQLNNEVGFIGKINDDILGQKYEEGLIKEKVKYLYSKRKESLPTGTCLILITPDSERTMCTFLGTAGKIDENDIDRQAIKNSEIIFLEGYLWDEGGPKKAFEKSISEAKKVAMSLSDLFCVERHKTNFLDLVKNKLDIIFANEQEILSLIDSKSFEEVVSTSDIVSLHLPLTPKTKNLIDKEAFKKMKPTALLINTARGGIFNETDVLQALKLSKIGGLGIDAYVQEPPVSNDLTSLKNVICTPHIGGNSKEAVNAMGMSAIKNLNL